MEGIFLIALLTIGMLLIVLHLVLILPQDMAQFLRSARQHLSSCSNSRKENSEQDAAVDVRMFKWQKNQFKWAMMAFSLIMLYMVVVLITTFLLDVDAPNLPLSVPSRSNPRQIVSILVSYGSTLLFLRFSKGLTKSNIDFFFWLMAVPVIAFKSPLVCNNSCELIFMERIAMQLLLVGRMDGLHTPIAGAAFCAASASGRFLGATVDLDKARIDAVATVMVLLLGCFLRRQKRAEARAQVESEVQQQQRQAVQALLKMFYDAVLELDSELRVSAGANELSAFLLQDSAAQLHGRHLVDFLQQEQHAMVTERLLQSRSGSMVEVVHAQMSSADGDMLEVELFSFSFLGPMGVPRLVVGLREYGEEPSGLPRQGKASRAEDEVALIVDTGEPHLSVLWTSASFQLLVGHVPNGASLEEQLCHGLDFTMWLQEAMNDLPKGQKGRPATVPLSKEVIFRERGCVQVRARCSLEDPREEDVGLCEKDVEDAFLTKLVFTQLERRRCRSSAHSSSTRGSRGRVRRTSHPKTGIPAKPAAMAL